MSHPHDDLDGFGPSTGGDDTGSEQDKFDPERFIAHLFDGDVDGACRYAGIFDARNNFDAAATLRALEALKEGGYLDPAFLNDLIDQLYEPYARQLRPLAAVLPHVTEKLGHDGIANLITPFLAIKVGVGENEDLRKLRGRELTQRAAMRKAHLDAHVEAGFTQQLAETLLIEDIRARAAMMAAAAGRPQVSVTSGSSTEPEPESEMERVRRRLVGTRRV